MIIAYENDGFVEFAEGDFQPDQEFPLDSLPINMLVKPSTTCSHAAVGVLDISDLYIADILSEDKNLFPKELSVETLVRTTIPHIKKTLSRYKRTDTNGNLPTYFFLAKDDKLLLLTQKGEVVEPPLPIGLDGDSSLLAIVHDEMWNGNNRPLRQKALKALDDVETYSGYVMCERSILSLKDGLTTIIERKGNKL